MNDPRHNYLLANAAPELGRLRAQIKVFEPVTDELFRKTGIQPGWNVADIGCGPGGVLTSLARAVGPTGKVTGADLDPKLLESARTYLESENLSGPQTPKISLVQDNLFESKLPPKSFNLTHARFLFAPLGPTRDILGSLCSLTRAGGIVVTQEPDNSSWALYPELPSFLRLKQVVEEAFSLNGGDFNAGRWTYRKFLEAGLQDIQIDSCVVALPPKHPYNQVVLQFAESLKTKIIASRLMTEQALDQAIQDVKSHTSRSDVLGVTFVVNRVWARVPN